MYDGKQDSWQSERLIFDGDEFFSDLARSIESAQVSVSIETYIFRPDPIGRRIEQLLKRAAKRGLEVRLLVDGIGSLGWIDYRAPDLEISGVKVRIYHPVTWGHIVPRWDHPNAPTLAARLNRRTHRKIAIIDGKIAYVGSVNMTAEHSREITGPLAWRDTTLRVHGGPIEDLVRAFDNVWLRSHDTSGKRKWTESLPIKPLPKPNALLRLNYTVRLRSRGAKELLVTMRSARHKLWITNAYFAPSGKFVRAILTAAQNGADVRLLVPRHSDVFFMPWVSTSHYKRLLKAGVRIYEYLPRFLHSKTMVIDDRALVGTSNLNRRSLFHDFEVDLYASLKETHDELERKFLEDLESAEEIKSAPGGPLAFFGRWIARILRNWI